MVALNSLRETYFPNLTQEEQVILGNHCLKLNEREREIVSGPSLERYLAQYSYFDRALPHRRWADMRERVEGLREQYLGQKGRLEQGVLDDMRKLETTRAILEDQKHAQRQSRNSCLIKGAILGGGTGVIVSNYSAVVLY